jgi:hypothetical protein
MSEKLSSIGVSTVPASHFSREISRKFAGLETLANVCTQALPNARTFIYVTSFTQLPELEIAAGDECATERVGT